MTSSEDGDADDVVDWTILKSIQEANAESMRAMEEYLLVATHPDAVGSARRTCQLLERSIQRHERIIDHLELAAKQTRTDVAVDAG